ncbi:hypothetical protein LEP1GSC041_3273 [Leptospira noguchii str. 2006001870]|nr:hypothetical protein LEP1GSC041_3273 [Leptospira noguchii str. 2006001870]
MINVISVSESMIHFSEKSWDLNFTDRFLKCRNYCKSRFYKQIELLKNKFSIYFCFMEMVV